MAVPELALVLTGGVVVGILSRWLVGWLAEEPTPSFAITILLQVAISAIAVFAAPHGAIVPALILGWSLGVLVVVDLIALRLPDILTLPLIPAGLLWAYLTPGESLFAHLIGAAVGFGVFVAISVAFRRLRSAEGLGLGDAKLLAAAGAWLGWRPLPVVILLAALGGIAWIVVARLRRGPEAWRDPMPFGLPLALATWVAWLVARAGATF